MLESQRARDAAAEEAGDYEKAEAQTAGIDGQPAQPMAQKDAEVGEHAGDVRGPDDGTAVGADHGILEAARARGGIEPTHIVPIQQRDGEEEEERLEKERDSVPAAELQRGVLNEESAQHIAGDEGADNGGEVERGPAI